MNKKYKLSPYCYDPEIKMIYPERSIIDQCTRDEIKYKFKKGIYGSHELAVMEVIYKYGYINRFNIERVLRSILPSSNSRPNYKNILRQMIEDEVVEKYCYDATFLYALTNAGEQYMQSKRYTKTPDINVIDKKQHSARLLEIASMAQYHISIISSLNNRMGETEERFYNMCSINNNNIMLPSYINLKGTRKSICLVAMPASKDRDGMKFMDLLNYCDKTLFSTLPVNRVMMVVVIVCTGTSEIISIGKFISRTNIINNITPIYALDSNTAKVKGLKWVYIYQESDGNNLISMTIDLEGTLSNVLG